MHIDTGRDQTTLEFGQIVLNGIALIKESIIRINWSGFNVSIVQLSISPHTSLLILGIRVLRLCMTIKWIVLCYNLHKSSKNGNFFAIAFEFKKLFPCI